MLIVASSLLGYKVRAEDGEIGVISDFLFDDRSWRFRWIVIETGNWLSERKVLIHPSAVLKVDSLHHEIHVLLTVEQVKASPDISEDQPVSMQKETLLYDYYGWDPLWGMGLYDINMLGGYIGPPRYFGPKDMDRAVDMAGRLEDNDPNLRSLSVVTGYHVHSTDGMIGHVENVLIDQHAWDVRYLIIDTSNWWMGQHVLLSPYAVEDISWSNHEISINLSRETVKRSPSWDSARPITHVDERELHRHYAWPNYVRRPVKLVSYAAPDGVTAKPLGDENGVQTLGSRDKAEVKANAKSAQAAKPAGQVVDYEYKDVSND